MSDLAEIVSKYAASGVPVDNHLLKAAKDVIEHLEAKNNRLRQAAGGIIFYAEAYSLPPDAIDELKAALEEK